jgi:hypothetical protein
MIETITLIGASIALLMTSTVVGSNAETAFPGIQGRALTGEDFEVPGDLAADYNLILVAFLREQQQDVDTWIPGAESLAESDSNFAFYEFPVLPEMNRLTRWFIYRGMRGGITSEEARARTVTFHLDKEKFRQRLGIETEEHISVFLVDSAGTLLWRTSGRWSQEGQEELKEALLANRRGGGVDGRPSTAAGPAPD